MVNFEEIKQKIDYGMYPSLGSGSGRIVFDLMNGYVVKVGKNRKGIVQNEAEYKISRQYQTNIIANIMAVSYDFRYLIMEKAEKVPSMFDVMSYFNARSMNEVLERYEIKVLINRFDLVARDLERKSSWGIVQGRPVIIDYGFTKHIRSKYYGFFR